MKQGYTDITIVLDRSGSMQAIKADTEGGFNHFVAEQKKEPGECRLTLCQFDTEYEFVYQGTSIRKVENLHLVPRGGTALLDAIGRTINTLGERLGKLPEGERPEAVLFVIITDGEENSSHEFSRDQIKEMIQHQAEVYNWKFVYLGANQDSFGEANQIGIDQSSTMNYAANPLGTTSVYESLSDNTRNFRLSGGTTAMVTDEDRKRQEEAGATS